MGACLREGTLTDDTRVVKFHPQGKAITFSILLIHLSTLELCSMSLGSMGNALGAKMARIPLAKV